MRAYFLPTGLSISVQTEDKDKSELECIIVGYKYPKLILKVLDTVKENRQFEMLGFHMTTEPSTGGFDIAKEVYIFIDKNIHHKVFEEIDTEYKGGYFETRSPYDRVDIHYFDPHVHRT